MIKKSFILTWLVIISGTLNSQENIQISPFIDQIHSRFYLIARLEQTIETLQQLHSEDRLELTPKVLASLRSLCAFENPYIQNCISDIVDYQSLDPLFTCWALLKSYKCIDDAKFAFEFSHLTYYLVEKLIHNHKSFLDQFRSAHKENPPLNTYHVTFRFYLLKRLTGAELFLHAHEKDIFHFSAHDMIFSSPQITECYELMLKTQSVTPLIKLFEQVKQYQFINDQHLICGFIQLIHLAQNATIHSLEEMESPSLIEVMASIEPELNKTNHAYIHASANQFVYLIYSRFYTIQRLEHVIRIIQGVWRHVKANIENAESSESKFNIHALVNFRNSYAFQNTRIQESIRAMQQHQTLKPFFTLWKEFATYKSIQDDQFTDELIKEIFVITRNILISGNLYARYLPSFEATFDLNAQELLDVIDLYAEHFITQCPALNIEHLHTSYAPICIPDPASPFHLDDILMRFYHVHRLALIFSLIDEIHQIGIPLNLKYETTASGVTLDSIYHFSHEHIVSIIKIMEQMDSVKPLLGLIQSIQQFKYINDETFTREYLMLTRIILQHTQSYLYDSSYALRDLSVAPLEAVLDDLDAIADDLIG